MISLYTKRNKTKVETQTKKMKQQSQVIGTSLFLSFLYLYLLPCDVGGGGKRICSQPDGYLVSYLLHQLTIPNWNLNFFLKNCSQYKYIFRYNIYTYSKLSPKWKNRSAKNALAFLVNSYLLAVMKPKLPDIYYLYWICSWIRWQ